MFEQDNLIIKVHGSDRFIAVREAFAIGKIKIEFRTYDKAKTQGSKVKQAIDIYMNVGKFTVLCEWLKSGRMFEMLKDAEKASALGAVNELISATNANVPKMLELYQVNSVDELPDAKLSQLKEQLLTKLVKQGGNRKTYDNRQPQPTFEHFGGKKEGSSVTSRILNVLSGSKYPVLFKASEGPGKEGSNGQFMPMYKSWDNSNSKTIQIPLSAESAVEMGIAGLRAVAIYDIWVANGTLEQNLARIHPSKDGEGQQGRQSYGRAYNSNGGGNGYANDGMYAPGDSGQMRSARAPYADNGAEYREMQPSGKQFGNRQVIW